MKKILFLFILISLVACNDDSPVNNGTDKTVIEKSVAPSGAEQTLESADGIRVIIPGGSLNDSLGIKLVKIASPPKLSSTTIILGSNIFKLTLIGNSKFNHAIEFRIKYDKSKIKAEFTPLTGVKGMVYLDNTWGETDYEIDVSNEEIVISLDPSDGTVSKYTDKLLNENEVIFGDGYTTTDTGQNDEFIGKMQKCFNISIDFSGYHAGLNNGEYSSIHVPLYYNITSHKYTDSLHWNGNAFSSEFEPNTKITGSIDSKAKTISVTIIADEQKIWEDTTMIKCRIEFINVPYDYDSMVSGYTFTSYLSTKNFKNVVKSIEYIKTIKNKEGKTVEEYQSTDFSKNASVKIEMIHK